MEASQFFEKLDSYKVKIGMKKGKNGLEQQTDKTLTRLKIERFVWH